MHKLNKTHILEDPKARLYQIKTPLIGLTGSIATGKSTVSKILREKGFKIIDADELVKNIYRLDETFDFISQIEPICIKDHQIDFKVLRERFFNDAEIKNKIEGYIYSKLPKQFHQELAKLGPQLDEVVIYDIPLLFEKQLESKFDLNVLVYAPYKLQLKRLIKRDHIPKENAQNIIQSQIDIEKKKSLANFVIDNSSEVSELKNQVDHFLQKILA